MRVGDVVYELCGHPRLDEADERHRERVRGDDLQCRDRQRDIRDEPGRQAAGQLTLVAHGWQVQPERERTRREEHDDDERRGDGDRELGHEHHDHDAKNDKWVDEPGHPDELGDLRGEDEDGQRVDEADHDTARKESHELGDTDEAQDDLHQTGQQHRGDEVVHAVLGDDGSDDERDGTSRSGDHGATPADEGDGDRHRERSEEADLRVHSGEDGVIIIGEFEGFERARRRVRLQEGSSRRRRPLIAAVLSLCPWKCT